MISAGFDSAHGDRLGQLDVTPLGYVWITQGLRRIQSRVCVVLEGGYCREALAKSSEAVVRTLMIDPYDDDSFNQILEKSILSDKFYEDPSEVKT